MGSYSSLLLDGYQIDQSKSYINTYWSCFFTEDDKRSRTVPYDLYYTEPINGCNEVPSFEYAATAETVKMRLEIMGYTLKRVESMYLQGIDSALKTIQEYDIENVYQFTKIDKQHILSLKKGGFKYWVGLLKHLIKHNINVYDERLDAEDDIFRFMLEYNDIDQDLYLGYPNIGFGFFLRGALEAVNSDAELVLDFTDLVSSGYYGENEAVCAGTAMSHVESTLHFQKIIILNEGSSDRNILSKALKVLYPKMENYFSFLDFESYKAEGGTGALEKTVKSFAAAGISNKIIALFDYDAAGVAAAERLRKKRLPNNICVMTLPEIDLARNYPTVGAQGSSIENVNGRACSIEMYLGKDILINDNNELTVVEWKGLEHSLNIYQGEIFDKARLQKKFIEKINKSISNGCVEPDQFWDDLRKVFQSIFAAAANISNLPTRLNIR